MQGVVSLLRHMLRSAFTNTSHLEKWISAIGGLVSLSGVILISHASLGMEAGATLVASMGASAVLLFAVPHGPLSQPWAVLGGHAVSALIGVTCAKFIPDQTLAAAAAVALAIFAMHYLNCIHPPGGATALSAVVGGTAVHQLGYQFLVTPVMLNALTIVLIAIVFNYPFPHRRYPVMAHHAPHDGLPPSEPIIFMPPSTEDYQHALKSMDTFMDVSVDDLMELNQRAEQFAQQRGYNPPHGY